MPVVSIGSINIDDVYSVPHIVQPGETISSIALEVFPGGKGANQAVAIARAGAECIHFGKIGKDGKWVIDLMKSSGVNVEHVVFDETRLTGKAIIQVDQKTFDNAIVLFPGTNRLIEKSDIKSFLNCFAGVNWVVLQNEINLDATIEAIESCKASSIICLNPAPFTTDLFPSIDMNAVHILILNTVEATELCKQIALNYLDDSSQQIEMIVQKLPNLLICAITLGKDGVLTAIRENGQVSIFKESVQRPVNVVDTTGAGDTFVGYFIATLATLASSDKREDIMAVLKSKDQISQAVRKSIVASGLSCEVKGAMSSIPSIEKVNIKISNC